MNNGQKHRSNHDGGQQSAGQSLDRQSSRQRQTDSDRSCISVFTAPDTYQQNGAWECYSRASEEAECQRLITISKANGLFIKYEDTLKFGLLYSKKTGESRVYANEEMGLVFKVHDPFAKRVLKDMHPVDAIYEHVIHNILFPNVRYNFVGITSENDEVRIILSQEFCKASLVPTNSEISAYLKNMGFFPEDHYYYGNEYLSITDVNADSDNVLKDERGELFFIDPIIKLKKPAPLVIDWLLSKESPTWQHSEGHSHEQSFAQSILSKIRKWFS